MKLIYFADGPWAHFAFDQIIKQRYEIVLMVLRYETRDDVLRKKAELNNIDCIWFKNINSPDNLERLRSYQADLGVSMSFNQIFKKELIELFPKGLINCHAGKLPNYRGRNVLNWALINGEEEIGVTCHYVDYGIDTGDIIYQKTFPVTLNDDYNTVLNKAYEICSDVLIHSIHLVYEGHVDPRPQTNIGSYFISRKNGDEFINWNWTSERIFNFVRAITAPGPFARTWLEYEQDYFLIYIKKVHLVNDIESYISIEGGVTGFSSDSHPLVKTGDTLLEIIDYEIDHHEKKRLKIGDRLGLNQNLRLLWDKK